MRKLIFKLGIQRIFVLFFPTLISWSGKHELRKYYAIFLRKKLRIQKHLQNLKWAMSKEFFSSRNFKNTKMSIFHNQFSPEVQCFFLYNYILSSLEMRFYLIKYQTRIYWRSINGAIHKKKRLRTPQQWWSLLIYEDFP